MSKRNLRKPRRPRTVPDWFAFQEQIAAHFQALGVRAETNVEVVGVRTHHKIDVMVTAKFLGVDIKWVVEAKHWKARVSQEKVFALRTILADIGADRGFIISYAGFQSGAQDSAQDTNVSLMTWEEFVASTRKLVQREMLQAFGVRLALLTRRYWSHTKRIRIAYRLRSDPYDDMRVMFSGQELLGTVEGAIVLAEQNKYPIRPRRASCIRVGEEVIENYVELSNWLNLNLNVLDEMLLDAEYKMIRNGDFHPDTRGDRTASETWEVIKSENFGSPERFFFEHNGDGTTSELQSGSSS